MKNAKQFARLLHYILGFRPDEFGLLPDPNGYVTLKDLLKVLHEEQWRHVRPHHLQALRYTLPDAGIEIDGPLIRACARGRLPLPSAVGRLPKELYAGVRRKAYRAVAQNGLAPPTASGKVLLFAAHELAQRVGRRRDAEPLIVTVQTTVARRVGVAFERFGANLYLADRIPAACCRLPAAPKALRATPAPRGKPPAEPPTAGSFALDWNRVNASAPAPQPSNRKSKHWRRERQRLRRLKRSPGDIS
jgi:putative RNA 2'-phosphotransferase